MKRIKLPRTREKLVDLDQKNLIAGTVIGALHKVLSSICVGPTDRNFFFFDDNVIMIITFDFVKRDEERTVYPGELGGRKLLFQFCDGEVCFVGTSGSENVQIVPLSFNISNIVEKNTNHSTLAFYHQ